MATWSSLYIPLSALLLAARATLLPNSCNDLEDGEYWMKLIDGDDYPPVQLKCSNGYTILDYNQDSNIESYFTSWVMWHYAIAGPLNGDTVNWNSWYKDGKQAKYAVSPDCSVCDEESGWQKYTTESTYWMSGNVFGCFWSMKAYHNCDMDFDSYTCYSCADYARTSDTDDIYAIDETVDGSDYQWTGMCVDAIRSASASIPESHDMCTEQHGIGDFKPSVGTDGRYCVCVQPSESTSYEIEESVYNEYVALKEESSKVSNDATEDKTVEYTSENHRIELDSSNFEFGTYRISTPGTYVIMEDIEFDFNSISSDLTDNLEQSAQTEGAWFPHSDQTSEYPGAGEYRDSYFLGFFAGITVECSDVVIDLNGHTLRQSDAFYLQQRWFTIIELASQQFLPGQGPGFFGADPQFATDVIIKNGVLGLSSHHGIHGNYNKNIRLESLKVRQFETHGIQLNGFDNVVFENVEVGPTSTKAYLRAEYGHMRVILPRLRKIAEENLDGVVRFDARDEEFTAEELADEVEKQMNMAYNYALNGITPECEDEDDQKSWESAQKVFINEDGIPYGSVQHGIFLNTEGTSVFNYNLETNTYSSNVEMNRVKIYGMRHAMDEWVRFSKNAEIYVTSFTSPIDGGAILGSQLGTMEELSQNADSLVYEGNIVTDVWVALDKLTDNWGYLGSLLVGNERMLPWVEGSGNYESYSLGCNVDAMLHSGKGILGLRVDGVSDLKVKGLEIYNLNDKTPLGRSECGEYSDYSFKEGGGHFRQVKPMQVGFSGNMVQGIAINAVKESSFQDVTVHDLTSETGAVFGIGVWPGNDIEFKHAISVYNIYAGTKVESDSLSYSDRPNKAPEGCAILDYSTYYDSDSRKMFETTITENDVNFQIGCISGHTGCKGTSMKTNVGELGTYDGCTPAAPKSKNSVVTAKLGSMNENMNVGSEVKDVSSNGKNYHWHNHPIMFVVYGILGLVVLYAVFKFVVRKFAIKEVKQLDSKSYSLLKNQMENDNTNNSENYGSVAL